MIRLCVFDLDGTLLCSGKTLTEGNAEALRALHKAGIAVAIASGRPPCYSSAYLFQAGIPGYVVGANGSYIAESAGKELYRQEFPPALLRDLTSYLTEQDAVFSLLLADILISNRPMLPEVAARFSKYCETARQCGLSVKQPEDGRAMDGTDMPGVLKISVIGTAETVPGIMHGAKERFPELEIVLSSSTVGDINLCGTSKGDGVRRLAGMLGIAKEEVACFGDYDNDLSMFENAGLRIAMGNATAHVKSLADYITKTNDEDGVAYAVRHVVLPV